MDRHYFCGNMDDMNEHKCLADDCIMTMQGWQCQVCGKIHHFYTELGNGTWSGRE